MTTLPWITCELRRPFMRGLKVGMAGACLWLLMAPPLVVGQAMQPMQRQKAEKRPEPPPVYIEPANPPSTSFEVNLMRLFTDDGKADIRVIFGYEDYEDFKDPNDPGRAERLVNYLLKRQFVMVAPTKALAEELGVRLDAPNLRILQGPGSIGQTLRVSLIWSAATRSASKNVGSGYAQQLICSDDSLKFMQRAAADAEVMYYIGHSRGGGGPDTFPPRTRRGNGENLQQVDFNYYGSEQPGLTALSPYFGRSRENPKIIALTGCLSDRHFHKWLSKRISGSNYPTSVILSTRLTRSKPWEDKIEGCDEALMVLVGLIETIQQHRTETEFKNRLARSEIEDMRDLSKNAWKLVTIPDVNAGRLADKGR